MVAGQTTSRLDWHDEKFERLSIHRWVLRSQPLLWNGAAGNAPKAPHRPDTISTVVYLATTLALFGRRKPRYKHVVHTISQFGELALFGCVAILVWLCMDGA